MVSWTARARADVKVIHDYIAKDSPINAKRVVHELDDPDIREIPAYSWRLIYQLRGERVFVLTVIHKRRQPGAADIA